MRRTLINPPELYEGVPYSYVAVVPEVGTVYTAGACPLDADGTVVESEFGTDGPPSTLLGVSVLGFRGQLVEIEAVAAR